MSQAKVLPMPPVELGSRILDSLKTALVCLDAKRRIVYLNATAETLFENSLGSLVGREFVSLLSQVEPSTLAEKLVLTPIALTEREAVITLASGKSFIADYSIYPCGEDAAGNELLLEIRPHERQAQIVRDEFDQLQRHASQQLARGLAHEIKNPLGGIRGAAQLLQKELDRPEWVEYTEVIISEVDRLQTLINTMLGPEHRLQPRLINIYEILEHIRKIVQAAEPERIEIVRDYDPSIPELMADRDLLIQAFLNIARNAVQAIDGNGKITFKTRVGRNQSVGLKTYPLVVQIDITDNGRGVPPELHESIFLPMVTDKADGTGLGLPIAREIITRHGGSIQLKREADGTTFSTLLPMEQS